MSPADLKPSPAIAELTDAELTPIDEDLLARTLEPYSAKGCRYLLDASYRATDDSVYAVGNFSIAESSYIRDTGHFNGAELIICFNQLAYSAYAPAILKDEIEVLRGWSIDDYFNEQLPSMLIKNTASRFRRPINAQNFSARLLSSGLRVVERSVRYVSAPCIIEFWDDHGGSALAEIELAALNTP